MFQDVISYKNIGLLNIENIVLCIKMCWDDRSEEKNIYKNSNLTISGINKKKKTKS